MTTNLNKNQVSFQQICRPPDAVTVVSHDTEVTLSPISANSYSNDDMTVSVNQSAGLTVQLSAPNCPVSRVRLRWHGNNSELRLVLGDAWERSYGDLHWSSIIPERNMPWYWMAWDGERTHGYGVQTRPAAFCSWQADSQGITLWIDVRSGGLELHLGPRVITLCTVVCREGNASESAFESTRAFCQLMCLNPRIPDQPVYGHNDWYADYGNNSDASIRRQCSKTVALAPDGHNRPFVVIDAGWQPAAGTDGGPWDRGNEKFPDMPELARHIVDNGAKPGVWIRPLAASGDAPTSSRLLRDPKMLDFTVPAVKQQVFDDIARIHGWGYQLIKHDFTTFDILGKWGFQMAAEVTDAGWGFAEGPVRTTVEIINDLYDTIREAAETSLLIGCNTVSHLSAGVFEMNRIGDDTSGHDWNRTRKMGINTLAFRAPQNGTFYIADADCVGLTQHIPWDLNAQWLELLSRSGTMTFVSMEMDAVGPEQEAALRKAYALAAEQQPLAEPLDWMTTSCPAHWKHGSETRTYAWFEPAGASLYVKP